MISQNDFHAATAKILAGMTQHGWSEPGWGFLIAPDGRRGPGLDLET